MNGEALPRETVANVLGDVIESMKILLRRAAERGATDVHVTPYYPVAYRIGGELHFEGDPVPPQLTSRLCYAVMSTRHRKVFEAEGTIDFGFSLEGMRFRANVYRQMGMVAGTFRVVNSNPPQLETLGLPQGFIELTTLTSGLIIVAGPTGSGKSTTLAAFVQRVNQTRRCKILTVEDPVEYLYPQGKAVISQREVGTDVESFNSALRYVLREDPDVVVIGEMRDTESVKAALDVSETGHLTLTTLHTRSVVEAMSRIVDIFPEHKQSLIRTQLSFVLEAVIVQRLLPGKEGGLVLAYEFLRVIPGVRQLIRAGKLEQVPGNVQSADPSKFVSLDDCLLNLVLSGKITPETAVQYSYTPEKMRKTLRMRGIRVSL